MVRLERFKANRHSTHIPYVQYVNYHRTLMQHVDYHPYTHSKLIHIITMPYIIFKSLHYLVLGESLLFLRTALFLGNTHRFPLRFAPRPELGQLRLQRPPRFFCFGAFFRAAYFGGCVGVGGAGSSGVGGFLEHGLEQLIYPAFLFLLSTDWYHETYGM